MSETSAETITDFGPWNPGIGSDLPARLLPLSTIFLPDNVFTSVAEACELRELTGLELEQLVVFSPQRLVVHELLIRITGDISVPDGNKVEDLGINFRRITHTILTRHLQPHMREIVRTYETVRRDIVKLVVAEVATAFDKPLPNVASPVTQYVGFTRWLRSLRRPRNAAVAVARDEDDWAREERVLREWGVKSQSAEDPMQKATYLALLRIASAVRGRHGHLWGNPAVFAPLVTGLACNEYGAELIGQQIEPLIREAAQAEGYGWLPAQQEPVVMNTKGASASGKSTMRPLQKKLAGEIGVNWSDFALVSPDIWRKYLLDYGSLGDDFKYAGTLTGKELAVIDQKLDRYMAQKAERGGMSHLLIDRFRFDSFAADSEEAGSNLLTRFGHHVYMFFMITPPHVTVERSWKRGHDVGRFKAVDDLLAHNVEAYTGMPELFFTWALRTNKRVHYEFLDNTESGGLPRTVAFGWNGEMNVLDVKSMLDIDRYRKINILARRPEEVYADAHAMAAEDNTEFLRQCARLLPAVNFADRDTGIVYARIEAGKLAWIGGVALDKALADSQTRAGLAAIAPAISSALDRTRIDQNEAPRVLQAAQFHTLGRWGERRVGLAQAVFPDEVR